MSINNVILIIGPSGVGKSDIGKRISKLTKTSLIDIDAEFNHLHGDIGSYGNKYGWENYFKKQSTLIFDEFNSAINSKKNILMVLPAGALKHPDYPLISNNNYNLVKNKSNIICILAHANDDIGANIGIDRQKQRNYKFDASEKKKQYLAQAKFYRKIANFVLINDKTIEQGVEDIIKFIKKIKTHS